MISMTEKMIIGLYDEIVKIRQLLEMQVRGSIRKELENILTTKERRIVWALCDGETDTKTIANRTGLSLRAVQITLKDLQDSNFIVAAKRGYPKRQFDYVPSEWRTNKEKEVEESEQGAGDT